MYRNSLEDTTITKSLEDTIAEFMSHHVSENMIKEDNIECCVCMNFHWGVKLPNCNHFICPKCYYTMYYGYVSDDFYANNPHPTYTENQKPTYPYINVSQNLQIYNNLTDDAAYLDWFINENEDLYNCIKNNEKFVDNVNANVKKWFETNDVITKYDNDLLQYENDLPQYELKFKKYINEMEIYNSLIEEERENNIQSCCPLCRL